MANKNRGKKIVYNFLSIKLGETQKELFSGGGVKVSLKQCPARVPIGKEFVHETIRNGWYELFVRDITNIEVLRRALAHLNRTKPENILLFER